MEIFAIADWSLNMCVVCRVRLNEHPYYTTTHMRTLADTATNTPNTIGRDVFVMYVCMYIHLCLPL